MTIVVDDYIENFTDKDCGLQAFSAKAFDIARAVAYPPAKMNGYNAAEKSYIYSVGGCAPKLAIGGFSSSEVWFSRDLLRHGVALDENGQVVLRERDLTSHGQLTCEATSFKAGETTAWTVISSFASQLEKMRSFMMKLNEESKPGQRFSADEPITFYVDDYGKVLALTFSLEDMEALSRHTDRVLYSRLYRLGSRVDEAVVSMAALDKPQNVMKAMKMRALRLNWLKLADGFAAAADAEDVNVMKAAAKKFVDGVKKLVEGFEFNAKKLQRELTVEILRQLSVTRSRHRFSCFSELDNGAIFK